MENLSQIESIYLAAVELTSPEERASYLDAACQGDPELRQRVERLLRAHPLVGDFLLQEAATPLAAPGSFSVPSSTSTAEGPGSLIGPYKLLEQIGEGGMGVVYMAEQLEPVRRRVALKVVKPGMDTKHVIARFEAERQALAMMDHPNIARVFDAGSTASGRPYFVMELVRGIPITDYCDNERLGIRDRLALFQTVCQAVQHAHQKGIIHRDLKPSNILVTLHDDKPVPKVIDFGVAKAIGQNLTDKTLFTGFVQLIGTPLYMSPEQAQLSGLDIDTRSDIYSLGVVLYELLTGTTPFSADTLKHAAFDEMRRIIREEEPPRPSTRLSSLGETRSTVSAKRHTDPRQLDRQLKGELDWIVMKCLEKNRNRRYETANALVADIGRHLHNEPVTACPPSASYRARKFLSRHRTAVILGSTAFVLLASLAIASSLAANRYLTLLDSERIAHDEALEAQSRADNQANIANKARADADRRAAEAQEVVDFLIKDLIGSASPDEKQGKTVTVDEVLERADATIATKFADQPLVEAGIRLALGETYENLGRYEKSKEHLERSVALYEENLGPEHADTLKAKLSYGWSLFRLNKRKEAEPIFESIREIARRTLGPEDPTTLKATHCLASSIEDRKRSIPILEELLPVRRRVQGVASEETLSTMNNLAVAYIGEGRYSDAKRLYEQIINSRASDDPTDTLMIIVMQNLLGIYSSTGEKPRQELLDSYRKITESSEKLLGFDHPNTNGLRNMYYWSLLRARDRGQRVQAAHDLVEQTLARAESELGFKHELTQWAYEKNEYLMKWEYRPPSELLAFHESYLKRVQDAFGPDAPETMTALAELGTYLLYERRFQEARSLGEKLVELLEKDPEKNLRALLDSKLCLATLARNDGHPEKAELLLDEVRARATDLDQVELANMISKNRYGPGRSDSPDAEPSTPLLVNAPLRQRPPALDGRIEAGEYGAPLQIQFTDTVNPGRLCIYKGIEFKKNVYSTKDPADLSYKLLAAHTEQALYLAVQVRDQFIDDQEFDRMEPHYNDHVEFYINGDLDANDLIIGMPGTTPYRGSPEGFQLVCDAAGQHTASAMSLANESWRVATGRTPDGYVIEFEIPLHLIDTRDGPEFVPPKTGSLLLMNVAVSDNDEYISAQTTYAAPWNDGEKVGVSFYFYGEDFWTIGLRLTPED